MAADDYTFNPLHNQDKELLLRHGYRPGELSPEDERELLADLRDQEGLDDDLSVDEADERDGA
jgi:hypothetical protein